MKIVFDFDGTLANSMPRLTTAATLLIVNNYGIEYDNAETMYLSCIGLSFREQLEELFPRDPKNDDVAQLFKEFHHSVYKTVQLHDGVKEELSLLDYFSIPYAVCSSSPTLALQAVLKHLGVSPKWVTGRSHGSKASQLFMYSRLGFDGFIGDATRDGELARDHNFKFVGVEYTLPREAFRQAGLDSEPEIHDAVCRLLEDPLYTHQVLSSKSDSSTHVTS